MERKVKVICSVVGFLGLLSVALFVAAEATRVKASQIQFTSSSTCLYPNSPAFGLGLTATVSLMVAQIIISIAAGCFCCRLGSYQSNSDRTWAVILFVMSWVVLVDISFKLLFGAAPNGHHGNKAVYFGTHPCYFVKRGVFGYAAALSFVAVFYEIAYLDLESKKIRNEAGIAKIIAHNYGGNPISRRLPLPNLTVGVLIMPIPLDFISARNELNYFGQVRGTSVSLVVAQIIFSIAAGCLCCRPGAYQSNFDRAWKVITFVLSWVGFVGAFFRLLSGAAHHGNGTMYSGTHPCYFVKSGAFGHAALLSFYAAAGGFAYLGLELVKISNEAGMAKVHPQGPTPPPQHPPA